MNTDFHRYPELRANAIRSADEHGILVARCLEVEDAAKASDLCVRARTSSSAYVWFDGLNERVPCIDGDACLCIGQALGLFLLRGQCSVMGCIQLIYPILTSCSYL